MKRTRRLTHSGYLALVALALAARPALAEDPYLHHAHSGALLAYADTGVQVLYTAFLSKEFDPDLVKGLLKELDRTLSNTKKTVDRTRLLVSDEKLEPEFTKLLDVVKRAEGQLRRLTTDVEEQTGAKDKEKGEDHRDEMEEGGGAEDTKADWDLLKNGAAWLYADLKEAKTLHTNAGKKLKGALKAPPKPAGKREE